MIRLKKVNRPEETFPMAPMIDMVFLLLVFFMCVSTLAQADKRTPLKLPSSHESVVPSNLSSRGIISVDEQGSIFISAREVSLEEMGDKIRDAIVADPALKIHLRADRLTPYGRIKKILEACAEAGAYEIIYATHQDSQVLSL